MSHRRPRPHLVATSQYPSKLSAPSGMSAHSCENAAKLGPMPTLPRLNSSLLVRTDFTSGDAWQQVSDEAQRENEDGFRAYIEPVSDPAFNRVTWEAVKAAVPANDYGASLLFVADSTHSSRQIIRYWS
jgi:hypothetical protein